MERIIFTGGGTLGHIYPMLPVIEKLSEEYPNLEVTFIGSERDKDYQEIINNPLIKQTYFLDTLGFKRSLSLSNIKVVYKYFKNKLYCQKLLRKLRPQMVIGMGGYVSAPIVKAAVKLKIPTIIHEQNACFGLANKLLSNKVDLVLLSYPIAEKLACKKHIVVGNPRSSFIYSAAKKYHKELLTKSKLLVVGGSLGASKINDTILSLAYDLEQLNIHTTLITGRIYYQENEVLINRKQSQYLSIIPFSKNIIELFINSDVIISRAGATTVAELAALKKVVVFIPSPNVTNNHQYKNILPLIEARAALYVDEKAMNPYNLLETIKDVFSDETLQKKIETNITKFTQANSVDLFINAIKELLLKITK